MRKGQLHFYLLFFSTNKKKNRKEQTISYQNMFNQYIYNKNSEKKGLMFMTVIMFTK